MKYRRSSAAIFLNLRNETLPGEAPASTDRHMRCSGQSQENGRFPLLHMRAPAACCCAFLAGQAGPPACPLTIKWVRVTHMRFSSCSISNLSYSRCTVAEGLCRAVLRCVVQMPCRRAGADTATGQEQVDPEWRLHPCGTRQICIRRHDTESLRRSSNFPRPLEH